MDLAVLFAEVAGFRPGVAAGRFAAAGVPVFPCVPGGKRPLTEHGFHDASTDAGQVAAWWRRWPAANLGMPTGSLSGFDVVDVDRKPGGHGFTAFESARRAGLVEGWAVLVRSPSGGMHAYYPADPDRRQPSWQAAGARVDFRGDGGYIVIPPSAVEINGRRTPYALLGRASSSPTPVNAVALRHFLDPRPEPATRRARGPLRSEDAERLAAWVGMRAEGERNQGLFWASCRLAEAGLSLAEMIDALADAGEQVGLAPREVETTIRSAFRATHVQPSSPVTRTDTSRPVARLTGQVLS